MRRLILPATVLIATACQAAAVEQRAVTTGPAVDSVTAWLAEVTAAVNEGSLERLLALYADDALSSPSDAPSLSVSELAALYEATFAQGTFDFTTDVLDVVVSGELGILRAYYANTINPTNGGEPVHRTGDWLVVLRRQGDGSWKLWREMWSVITPVSSPTM
jgi:uncharacterized protein (TIGR02246 family)